MSAAQQFPRFCAKFGTPACIDGLKEDLCMDSSQLEKAYEIATALQNTHLIPNNHVPFTSEDAEVSILTFQLILVVRGIQEIKHFILDWRIV